MYTHICAGTHKHADICMHACVHTHTNTQGSKQTRAHIHVQEQDDFVVQVWEQKREWMRGQWVISVRILSPEPSRSWREGWDDSPGRKWVWGHSKGLVDGWWGPGLGVRKVRGFYSQRLSWKENTGFREWREKKETQLIGVGHHESCAERAGCCAWSMEIWKECGGVGTLARAGTGALMWTVFPVSVRTKTDPGTCGGREHKSTCHPLALNSQLGHFCSNNLSSSQVLKWLITQS
jgi:hypothetical protein